MTTTAEIEQIQGVTLSDGVYEFGTTSTINSVGGDTGFDQTELFLFRKAEDENDDEYIQLCAVGDRLEYEVGRDVVVIAMEDTGWVDLSAGDIGAAVSQQSPGTSTGILVDYDNSTKTIRVQPDVPIDDNSFISETNVGLTIGATTTYVQTGGGAAPLVSVGDLFRKAQAVSSYATIQEAAKLAAAERQRLQYLVDDWEALVGEEVGTDTTTVSSTAN